LLSALASVLVCAALVVTRGWHGRFSLDGVEGVQKFHLNPTPRIGGLGAAIGLIAGALLAPAPVASVLWPMLWAGLPAFAFGLAEDLTRRVSVRSRLLATMASGLVAWWLTGVSLTRVEVWGVDALLAWGPASVLFTAFAVGGVANAVNIIDGFNGLAAGVLLITLLALGVIAQTVGDTALAGACLVVGGAVLGFMVVNFPFGKIFLGDGGAYLLGFIIAWLAVLLASRNPGVSPWAGLLACAYPVLEVLFTIYRRTRRRHHPGHPDRLHLHSLINARVTRKWFPALPPVLKNAAVSPFIWVCSAVPAACGLLFRAQGTTLILMFIGFAGLYAWAYRRLVRFSLGVRPLGDPASGVIGK
jgi:UDP-N-acetylmuramyl pentapeptide phosphotransferase/UDP-N-acetylglucosamine-1-phosphate transferase